MSIKRRHWTQTLEILRKGLNACGIVADIKAGLASLFVRFIGPNFTLLATRTIRNLLSCNAFQLACRATSCMSNILLWLHSDGFNTVQ